MSAIIDESGEAISTKDAEIYLAFFKGLATLSYSLADGFKMEGKVKSGTISASIDKNGRGKVQAGVGNSYVSMSTDQVAEAGIEVPVGITDLKLNLTPMPSGAVIVEGKMSIGKKVITFGVGGSIIIDPIALVDKHPGLRRARRRIGDTGYSMQKADEY